MEAPVAVDSLPLDRVVLSKRFSVVQGRKIRPVDDATASGLNPRTRLGRAIGHDSIDQLEELARVLVERGCRAPQFWKADVDAAYRRIALRVAARAAAYVVFLYRGKAYAAKRNAAFFGATSSVESWARLGARHLASFRIAARRGTRERRARQAHSSLRCCDAWSSCLHSGTSTISSAPTRATASAMPPQPLPSLFASCSAMTPSRHGSWSGARHSLCSASKFRSRAPHRLWLAAPAVRTAQATRQEFWAVPAPQKVEMWSSVIRGHLCADKLSPGACRSRSAPQGRAARGRRRKQARRAFVVGLRIHVQ